MDLLKVVNIAKQAGAEILKIYQSSDSHTYEMKQDKSPLTKADKASHQLIVQLLKKLTPDIPIISEEGECKLVNYSQKYWLVDPLDGTKEFLDQNDEFTVNIALIQNSKPTLGVVYAPAYDLCYYASNNTGSFKQIANNTPHKISIDHRQNTIVRIAVSRRHDLAPLKQFISHMGECKIISMGSSLKICAVAEGIVDIYPRFGPTMEWDTAAAQCVIEQAGGIIVDKDTKPLQYNKLEFKNPNFLATAKGDLQWAKYLE